MAPVILVLTLSCGCSGPIAGETHPPAADVPAERRYDGLTLAEWQERIKNLDFASESSAAAAPGLIAIVRDHDAPSVSRRQAAATLGRIGPLAPEGVPALLDTLDEPGEGDASPRVWAVKGLALYGPVARDAAPVLLKSMQDRSRPLLERDVALEALFRIGPAHPQVVPALLGLLDPPRIPEGGDPRDHERRKREADELRELAVEGFPLLGPSGSAGVPALIRIAQEPSDVLRLKGVMALGSMGGRGEIAVPTLAERLLFDESRIVRDAAAEALAKIGIEALPILTQLLDDADAETRGRAADALGRMGPPARPAAAPLTARLDDESLDVRLRAAEALWKITRNPRGTLEVAVAGLTDPDRSLRLRAYRLLTAMGDKAVPAIPQLRKLADDQRGYVRDAATKALERLSAANGSPATLRPNRDD